MIIDLNVASGTTGEERLVTDFATQVLSLRDWVGEVFDQTPAVQRQDENEPQQQIRTLAAGVMVKTGEVMERYQGRLMGVNSGFKY
ncbi:Telomere length regulation protein [Aspergillus sclerotialis]|uniref:Telomere length regulation protein n=1 Tax=Aspergillus sclerotialis TaxID=2070753 RepID=A0A3A2Z461_9EURO|nr:Telomere length regulation protein [Aspergillus sclerotialis]